MLPQRLNLVTIGAWDVAKLRTFYNDLGWKEEEWSSNDYSVFINGGAVLSIWSIHELSKDAVMNVPENFNYFRGISFAVNVNTREEVDQAVKAVKSAGGKIVKEAHDAFWGGRSGNFLDPENNLWEIAYNPNSKFDERGAMIEMNG
jgi:predicted lactoylglutathione lyase